MKNILPIIAFTAFAAAQNGITDLPSCALTCLITAVGGLGCDVTDFACSCKKADQLTPVVTPCVQTACPDVADQTKTIAVLSGICAAAGFPIEAPQPPASSPAAPPASSTAAAQPTSTAESASSKAPVETQPSAIEESEYPAYPTAAETTSEYPAPTHATDDVPNLPSSYSHMVPLPSSVETVTVPHPSPKPTSASAGLPPYPTGGPASSVPAPSGTNKPSTTSSQLPEFTGAAVAVQVPVVAAGILGLAAFVL